MLYEYSTKIPGYGIYGYCKSVSVYSRFIYFTRTGTQNVSFFLNTVFSVLYDIYEYCTNLHYTQVPVDSHINFSRLDT